MAIDPTAGALDQPSHSWALDAVASQGPLPDLADLPAQPPARHCGDRHVCGWHRDVSAPLRLDCAQPRPQTGFSFRGHPKSHAKLALAPDVPALRPRPALHHVFGDRRLGDLEAKHQDFAMDPGCPPLWVLPAHPADEITIDLGPPCPLPRFPAPECCEARAVPPKDGLRLNDLRRTEQARPEPGHPDQQGPITAAQPKMRRRTPQGDAELMAKEQVLGYKPASRLKQVERTSSAIMR